MRIGVAQLTSTDQVDVNLQAVEKCYVQAAKAGADLVVFPENTLFFRIRSGDRVRGLDWLGDEMKYLQSLADRSLAALMLTTAIEDTTHGMFNATVVFQAGLEPELLYKKIHLFDVDVVGAAPVRESDSFSAGGEPRLWEFRGWRFGLSICYDLRFAELYLRYAQRADVILVPSAFLVPTGKAHWHTLLRARAIESQCYVVAPAQQGEHRSGEAVRQTFGHSLIIDPWGTVLYEFSDGLGVHVLELKRAPIEQVRTQIPMSAHRRLKPV